jgi:glycosyltransferase involved in cell wall biosynthesis
MRVLHYQRRSRANANYSLEFIFEDVRSRLKDQCEIELRIAPQLSNGLFPRLAIVADAWMRNRSLIHVTGDIDFAILGARRDSSILTVLDCGFVNRSRGLKRWILKKIWLDLPVRWTKFVTTISTAARDEIIELTNCDPEKVIVIPVAISSSFQHTPKPFNADRPRILLIGTAPNKNLAKTLDALAGLPCELTIVGVIGDAIRSKLRSYSLPFENLVNLSYPEVVAQYQRADLLCFASSYEGFGMPILEAQATGRPVITSNTSSMPEVAGDAAHLVDPFDVDSIRSGVLKVIEDREYRERLIQKGLENVKRYDPNRIAGQYLALYRRISS